VADAVSRKAKRWRRRDAGSVLSAPAQGQAEPATPVEWQLAQWPLTRFELDQGAMRTCTELMNHWKLERP
jgi:hypothetical protein